MRKFYLVPKNLISAFLLGMLVLVGCAVRPEINRTPASQYINVELASNSLQENLTLSSLNGRIDNDMLSINVSLFVNSAHDMPLQYKMKWFDEFGSPVSEGLFNWTPMIAKAKQTFTISKRAVSNKAVRAIVVIQQQ